MASRRRSPISSRSRKKTGVKIKTETYDGTLAAIKDKIGASSSPFDIVDLSQGALDALCRDGLLETIDSSALTLRPRRSERKRRFSLRRHHLLRHRQRRLVDGDRLRPPGLHQGTARRRSPTFSTSSASRESGRCPTARATRSSLRCSPTASIPPTSTPSSPRRRASTAPSRLSTRSRRRSCGGTRRRTPSPC